ncbi:Tripartite tricarboxylate transporter TctB family protein [Modicisalibacter muralis]|uniref:Tripartite tricarboxylate transporter TctB family protein n=1 Tax=Modicisalibacter muralis TaxID=119000 RepID=A0A1G9JP40_9GAMM|nr:tripartite tricarboxylate transporter TctB family protein [Halomonas muralis]SDL39288.1 Tripartite tricarboxylate transporter TctB family protein [Halomonas muralis]
MAHIVFNGLLAALFIFLFVRAGSYPSSMWEPLGSGTFPRLVLGMLVLFNVMIVVQETRHFLRASPLPAKACRAWIWRHRLMFGVLLLFALLVFAVPTLGFRWSSLVFLFVTQVLLGARHWKSLLIAGVIAVAFSFGVEIVFREVFLISLPRGLLD